MLETLGLRVETYEDPRKFLLDIKNRRPPVAFVDLSVKPIKVPVAIVKTVRNVLGPTSMTVAVVSAGDKLSRDEITAAGVTAVVEKPVAPAAVARLLQRSVVTDGIAEALRPRAAKGPERKAAPETAAKPAPEKAAKPAPEKAAEPAPEKAAEAAPEKPAEPAPEKPAEPAPEKPAEPAPAPAAAARLAGGARTPEAVSYLFNTIMPVLARLDSAMEWHDDVEVQFQAYAVKLGPHREQIVNLVRLLRKSEETLDLIQSLRKFGLVNTRALTVALALAEALPTVKFGFDAKTGLLTGDPVRALAFASRTGDHFGDDSRYFHVAFASGLVFDVLAALMTAEASRKHALLKALEAAYAEGLRRVDKAYGAAKAVKALAEDQHVTSTILMREAGRLVMALAHPDYLDLRAVFEKKSVKPSLQHLAENRKYQVSHNLVGALLSLVAPALKGAYSAVLFFDYPFMLKGRPEDRHARELAQLCGGAT